MRILFFIFLLSSLGQLALGQEISPANKPVLYLIPGQGADARLYNRFAITGYDTVRLQWLEPKKKETMAEFAARMAEGIDTTRPVILVGVSLGGMVSAEISRIIPVEAIVFISSAKRRQELPFKYQILRLLPFHRLFGGNVYIKSTPYARRIVEPESWSESCFYDAMIAAKTPCFMEWTVNMIANWERKELPEVPYFHLHGLKDGTLPHENIYQNQTVKKGGHMMVYSKPEAVYKPVQNWLDRFCEDQGY